MEFSWDHVSTALFAGWLLCMGLIATAVAG